MVGYFRFVCKFRFNSFCPGEGLLVEQHCHNTSFVTTRSGQGDRVKQPQLKLSRVGPGITQSFIKAIITLTRVLISNCTAFKFDLMKYFRIELLVYIFRVG